MPEFIDAESGKTLQLDGPEAHAAYLSGKFGLPKDKPVRLIAPDGATSGIVSHDQVQAALGQGYRFATSDEEKHAEAAKLQAEYGGAGSIVRTALERGLSSATLGLSDEAMLAGTGAIAGPEARESLRHGMEAREAANPGTAIASEIGGAVLPALVGDEASLAGLGKLAARAGEGEVVREGASLARRAASIAAKPMEAVSLAGKTTERAVTGLLGETGKTLAGKAIAKSTATAVEGGLIGAAQQVDEDTLGDHETTAEKLVAATTMGALLGAPIGGVIHLGGEAAGQLHSALRGPLARSVEKASDEQWWRVLNPREAATKEAEARGGVKRFADRMREENLAPPGSTLEQVAANTENAKESAFEAHKQIVSEVGGTEVPFHDLDTALSRLEKSFAGDISAAGAEREVAALRERAKAIYLDAPPPVEEPSALGASLESGLVAPEPRTPKNTMIPLDDLLAQRRALEQEAFKSLDPAVKTGKKAAGRAIEDVIMSTGDRAAEEAKVGSAWKERYQASKRRIEELLLIDKTAQKGLRALESNRKVGPSTYIASMIGGAVGAAAGHPIVGHVAGAGIHHVILHRGNSIAAHVLDRMASLTGIQRATATVDREVDRGVAGILRPGERVPAGAKERAFDKSPTRHHDAAESIAHAVADVDAHATRLERASSGFAEHAPKVAAAFQMTALRGTQWLAKQIPAALRAPPATLAPQFEKPYVSPSEAAAFLRKYDAVHDPASVLDDMRKGLVTQEQIDAVRAVYPKLYAEITQRIADGLHEAKTQPSMEMQKQITLFFGLPASSIFEPAFVRAMQAPAAKAAQTKSAPVHGAPKRKITDLSTAAALPGQVSK